MRARRPRACAPHVIICQGFVSKCYVRAKNVHEVYEITICLEGFRHARAAAARMCPAWYYLTGIVALAGARTSSKHFEVRAKVAREAAIDGNVEKKQLVFQGFSKSARAVFQFFL